MVYFRRWEEFTKATADLYEASPKTTRYCVRWKHGDGLLVLKVTDDRSCLKFKTRSAVFLNRFELFNRSILSQMQHRKPAPAPEPTEPAAATTDASPVAFASAEGAGVPLEPSTEPSKKKKKSKKKK